MPKTRRDPVVWRFKGAPPCYAIADVARLLGRSRTTLMRWLPEIKAGTGYAPVQDATGRWFLPVPAVVKLRDDAGSLARVVRRASEARTDSIATLRQSLQEAHDELARLKADVAALRSALGKTRGKPSG